MPIGLVQGSGWVGCTLGAQRAQHPSLVWRWRHAGYGYQSSIITYPPNHHGKHPSPPNHHHVMPPLLRPNCTPKPPTCIGSGDTFSSFFGRTQALPLASTPSAPCNPRLFIFVSALLL